MMIMKMMMTMKMIRPNSSTICITHSIKQYIKCKYSIRVVSTTIVDARTCTLEKLNNIMYLSLNNPKSRNALSNMMIQDLNHCLGQINDDKEARVLIIRSNIDKVFCAGADLKERLSMGNDEVEAFVDKLRSSFHSISTLPFPTIACIDGAALGGGLELALACDIRVVGMNAVLGLPETSLAIIPGAGGTQRLSRLVGIAKAKELIFTGVKLNAMEAYSMGLVNHVELHGSAMDKAESMANKILQHGPIGIKMAKQAIDEGASLNISDSLLVEKKCYSNVIHTQDRIEGLTAFIEKRMPVYKGI